MARQGNSEGIRDLSLLRASGSTARVINLALIYERFGKSDDFKENPLFRCEPLNRALIVKHALRPHERALFERPTAHATKIIFPFSPTELSLGGTSVMLGELQFEKIFRNTVGRADPFDLDADMELLDLLNDVPSFDPFLIREQLRRLDRTPARCFFEVSDADISSMIRFVATEIEPLAALAFGAGGRRIEKMSERLAEKLMMDEGAQMLEPLRAALAMNVAQYREGIFAWKGFLYYKWSLGELEAGQEHFGKTLALCRFSNGAPATRMEVEKLRRNVIARANLSLLRTHEAMREYESAFGALSRGAPMSFRDFLLSAPGRFVALGEAIGAMKHMHSIWGFRFPSDAPFVMEAEEALTMLGEFDRMLATAEFTQEHDSQELAIG